MSLSRTSAAFKSLLLSSTTAAWSRKKTLITALSLMYPSVVGEATRNVSFWMFYAQVRRGCWRLWMKSQNIQSGVIRLFVVFPSLFSADDTQSRQQLRSCLNPLLPPASERASLKNVKKLILCFKCALSILIFRLSLLLKSTKCCFIKMLVVFSVVSVSVWHYGGLRKTCYIWNSLVK